MFFTFYLHTGGLALSNDTNLALLVSATAMDHSSGVAITPLQNGDGNTNALASPGSFRETDRTTTFAASVPPGAVGVRWGDLGSILLGVHMDGTPHITFARIGVFGRDSDGNEEQLFDSDYRSTGGDLWFTTGSSIVLPVRRPSAPSGVPGQSPEETEDQAKRIDLLDHVQYHAAHYNRSMALNVEKEERARQLDALTFPDGSTALDKVENRPLEVLGDFVAYPCADPDWSIAMRDAVAAAATQGSRLPAKNGW